MRIRDRIKELRRVRAADLRPHPANWRTHPPAQRDALRGVLAEIGYAAALLARELPDGSLELIDGHLRAETTPDAEVPVLVLDVTSAEAALLLAVFDPLSALAGADRDAAARLAADVQTDNSALRSLLDEIRRAPPGLESGGEGSELSLAETYQVIVTCRDEDDQRAVYERLTAEGYACRLTVW